MATTTAQLTGTSRADLYLDYLETEWAAVPSVSASWASYDEDDRLDFQLEWGIREDRLGLLEEMASAAKLTPHQNHRLTELLALIARNRSIVERLFDESVTS